MDGIVIKCHSVENLSLISKIATKLGGTVLLLQDYLDHLEIEKVCYEEEISWEEAKKILHKKKIEKGLADAKAGRIVTFEEAREHLSIHFRNFL